MNTPRLSLVVGLGLGLASVGCIAVPEEDGVYIDALDREAMDNPTQGSGSQNHLSDEGFHAKKIELIHAAGRTLGAASPLSTNQLNPLSDGMTSTSGGKELLSYAVRCALPVGNHIYYGSPATNLFGSGLLTTTASWRTAALTTSQTEDLMACLALHINPASVYVNIMLSGASVANTVQLAAYEADYPFLEAVWTADVVSGPFTGSVTINVWPQENLIDSCEGTNLDQAIATRVCGTPLGQCGLVVRTDIRTACTVNADGDYTCDGKPAILTRLPAEHFSLYPKCVN